MWVEKLDDINQCNKWNYGFVSTVLRSIFLNQRNQFWPPAATELQSSVAICIKKKTTKNAE